MSEWPSFTIAELQQDRVLLVEDGNHGEYRPRPHEFVEDGTRFIRAADLAEGQVQFPQAGGISDVALSRIRKGIGKPGDILFSHKGTVGKLARVPMDAPTFVCSPQTTFWRVLDESRLRRDYLYAFMRSRAFIDQWWARKGETDMADYVSLTAQRQLRVTVPPVAVQRRIAEPLGAIDDLVENNRRRIELLEQMAQTIYREWFVHFRYPGHEDAALVDSPRGPIPEGWEVQPLGVLAALDRASVQPRRSPDEAFDHYSIPAFDDDQLPVLDKGEAIKSGKFSLTGPAVMVSKLNPRIERTWFVEPIVDRRSVASTEFLVLRPQTDFSLEFLYLLARSTDFQERLRELSGGTSTSHQRAKPDDFLRIEVVSPPAQLAGRLADAVAPPLRMTRVLRVENRALAGIRDLLLPKLVTGEIDVSSLDLDALAESVA